MSHFLLALVQIMIIHLYNDIVFKLAIIEFFYGMGRDSWSVSKVLLDYLYPLVDNYLFANLSLHFHTAHFEVCKVNRKASSILAGVVFFCTSTLLILKSASSSKKLNNKKKCYQNKKGYYKIQLASTDIIALIINKHH